MSQYPMNKYLVVLQNTKNPIMEVEAFSMSQAILLAMIQACVPEEVIKSITKI
jgi:hypothetical protein